MAKCFNSETLTYFSPRPPMDFPTEKHLSITSFLFKSTSSLGPETALADALSGQTLTFSELEALVSSLARALSETIGVEKNDVVLILAPNSIHFVAFFLAVAAIGAVTTTCNPAYTVGEIEKMIGDSKPKIVVTTLELFDEKIEKFGLPSIIFPATGSGDLPLKSWPNSKEIWNFSDLVVTQSSDESRWSPPHDDVSQDDVAAVLYSSGTTGMSKGVVLTHRNFIATSLMVTSDQDMFRDPRNVFLCCLPMFHIFGLFVIAYSQLRRGNAVVCMEKFELSTALKAVENHRVTHLYVVPPVAIALAKYRKIVKRYDISSVREILSGAAPLGRDVMEGVAENIPNARIVQAYGLTETCGLISMEIGRNEGSKFSGSSGHLYSGIEAKIISVEMSNPLPPNELGEIWLKGPSVMQGYYNNPEATKVVVDDQGWLHTGDLGYFDNNGELFIVDRIKELIKCYGFQVAPAELEALLLSHPQILDAVVIPFPDENAGQVPIAQIVRSPESSITEHDVQRFVDNQVAPFKRLRRVTFVSSVPKSPSGKILRRKLVEKVQSRYETRLSHHKIFGPTFAFL